MLVDSIGVPMSDNTKHLRNELQELLINRFVTTRWEDMTINHAFACYESLVN